MFPILQLGPLAVQVPGLVLLVSLWLGLALAEREAKRLNLNADAIYTLALTGLIAGVIGARLAYAARYPGAYLRDPFGLFSLNPSALAQTDGMLIGLVAAYVYGAPQTSLAAHARCIGPGVGGADDRRGAGSHRQRRCVRRPCPPVVEHFPLG